MDRPPFAVPVKPNKQENMLWLMHVKHHIRLSKRVTIFLPQLQIKWIWNLRLLLGSMSGLSKLVLCCHWFYLSLLSKKILHR
jgi:hypothetical protein